jgi:hypothetical protein
MSTRTRLWVPALAAATAIVVLAAIPAAAAGKTVHITKSDSAGNAVQGATFTLYVDAPPVGGGPPKGAEDTTVQGTCTTGANGQCDITNVPPGDYWVSETGPPAGYVAAPDSTLKVKRGKKQVFEVVVVDDKKPANTSVNDPTEDASFDDGTHISQYGPAVAASPNGRQVFVAFNDPSGFYQGERSAIGFSFSSDGGRTWQDRGQVPTGDPDRFLFAQPSVLFDPGTGSFVVAAQGAVVAGTEFTLPLLVGSYAPGSGEWSPLVDTFPGIPPGARAHDPWLAVDAGAASPHAGTVYLGFTQSDGGQAQGFLARSLDGGRTWKKPVAVTELATNDFLNPAVAPDGSVYVAWTDFGGQAAPTNDFFVSRSTDGGKTFSRAFAVAADVAKSGALASCGGSQRYAYLGALVTADAPRVAVDPTDPRRVIAVYTAGGGADSSDVLVSESTDAGRTWTPGRSFTYPAGTQMFPDIEITPDGRIGVSYYDARSADSIDFVTAFSDVFADSPLGVGALDAFVPVTDAPFGLWNTNPGYDSFTPPCFGMQGNQMAAPGSGFLVAWADGGDPGPAANGGIDPNIDAARLDPSLATTTTLEIDAGGSSVRVEGSVAPDPVLSSTVTLTLFFDDGPGGFERVDRARPPLGEGGTFAVTISPTGAGRCRLVASFDGSEGRLASSTRVTFAC